MRTTFATHPNNLKNELITKKVWHLAIVRSTKITYEEDEQEEHEVCTRRTVQPSHKVQDNGKEELSVSAATGRNSQCY